MDTEEKLEELKKYRDAMKARGGSQNEFEEHVFWLCEVAEGSYCINPDIETEFWGCVNKMLDTTLDNLDQNYEFKNTVIPILTNRK